jgi:hypothetical protein
MKKCSKCDENKSLDQYYKNKASKDGIDYYCKSCRSKSSLISHMTNKNPCTWNDCSRPHYGNGLCKIHYRRKAVGTAMDIPKDGEFKYKDIKRKYKLDKETYLAMAKDGCQVCSSKERLNVDHDHACCDTQKTCGKCVRGIICSSCNITLSKLEQGIIHPANTKKIQLLQYILDYELKKKSLA